MKKIGIFLLLFFILVTIDQVNNIQASRNVEIEYLRTSNSKVYDMGEGVYQYQYFEEDVHYYTQEGYKNYNQTLEYNNTTGEYETSQNNYNVSVPVMDEVEHLFSEKLNKVSNEYVQVSYYDLYQIEIEYTSEMNFALYSDNQIQIEDKISNLSSLRLEPRNHNLSEVFTTQLSQRDSIVYHIHSTELSVIEVDGIHHFVDKYNASIFYIDNYYSRGINGQFFFGNKTTVEEISEGVYEIEITLDESITQNDEEVYPVSTYGGISYSLVSTPSGIRDKTIIEDTTAEYDVDYFTVSKQTLMPAPAGSVPYLPVYNLYSIMELDFSDISGSNITVLDAKLTIQRESSNVNTKVPVSVITSAVTFDSITGNTAYTTSLLSLSSVYTDLMVYDITQQVSDEIRNGDNTLLLEFSPEMIGLNTSTMKYMHFYSENANQEQSPYFTVDVEGLTLSSDYGDAPSYTQVNGSSTNCFGYALRKNDLELVIYSASNTVISFGTYGISESYYYKVVVPSVLFTINTKVSNYSARVISNVSSSIDMNEYRIALRVGNIQNTSGSFTTVNNVSYQFISDDFHFVLQLNDGSWGSKQGELDSVQLVTLQNPSSSFWNRYTDETDTIDYIKNYYDSPTVYFAVRAKVPDWV